MDGKNIDDSSWWMHHFVGNACVSKPIQPPSLWSDHQLSSQNRFSIISNEQCGISSFLSCNPWMDFQLLVNQEINCQLLAKMYLFAVHLHPLGHGSNLSFIYRVSSLTDDITWSVILAKHHICWWWCKSILKYRDNIFQNESLNFVLYIILVF